MKTNTNTKVIVRITLLVLITTLAITTPGCGEEFDDSTMALVKKPEVLAVIFDPPEAAPGETVTASFLIADEKGVLDAKATLWMPITPGAGSENPNTMNEVIAEMNVTPAGLASSSFTFTVPTASHFTFDEAGQGGMLFGFYTAITNDVNGSLPLPQLAEAMEDAVIDGRAKQVMRTLVVSENLQLNDNPELVSVFAKIDDELTPIPFASSSNGDLPAGRQASVDAPFVVEENTEMKFVVNVEDEGDVEASIRYQWISTGGDFQGRRKRVQPWTAPEFKELSEGDEDLTGQKNGNARIDPNLYPVWIIVRDNGVDGQLGQTFAEFYVRIVPAP